MDLVKIGKFIAEMRKKQGFTQKELADMLGVSDKTISKWETGRSMPDNTILLKLCQSLGISVNELLSGESFSEEHYKGKAEKNMVFLMKEQEEQKKQNQDSKWSMRIGFLLLLMMCYVIMKNVVGWGIVFHRYFDIPSLCEVVGLTVLVLVASGQFWNFYRAFYICYGKSTEKTYEEMTEAYNALKLAVCSLLLSGGFVHIVGLIGFLPEIGYLDWELIGVNVSVSLLAPFYGVGLALLLLPTIAKLNKKIGDVSKK